MRNTHTTLRARWISGAVALATLLPLAVGGTVLAAAAETPTAETPTAETPAAETPAAAPAEPEALAPSPEPEGLAPSPDPGDDTVAPVVQVGPTRPLSASGWIIDRGTYLVVQALDASEIDTIEYRRPVEGGGWTPWAVLTEHQNTEFPAPESGVYPYQYRASDVAGNVSEPIEYVIRTDFEISSPTVSGFPSTFEIGETYELFYGCTDRVSGVASCTSSNGPSGTVLPTDVAGTHSFTLTTTDVAGNTKTTTWPYTVIAPDTTAPIVEVTLDDAPATGGWFDDDVSFFLRATDDLSGVAQVWVEAAGAQPLSGRFIDGASFSHEVLSEGVTVFTVWAEDAAGNVSAPRTVTVRIDRTAPTIQVTAPSVAQALVAVTRTVVQAERVELHASCADALSGILDCVAPELLPTNETGEQRVQIVATDLAGNTTTEVVRYTVIPAATQQPGGSSPSLAHTGSEWFWLLLAAVGLLLSGLVFVTVRARTSR